MAVVGTETEYGVWAAGLAPGQHVDAITLSEAVVGHVEAAGTRWDYADEQPLVDARGGVLPRRIAHPDQLTDEVRQANRLLANGGRSYVDHAHPEWSGPEVTSAHAALVRDLAGDQIHLDAARRASERLGLDIRLARNTTDNQGHSYGCHENYLVLREVPFADIVERFAGHLASRVVTCGAGRVGLGQRGDRCGYQVSQRADFIERLTALATTTRRPLVNTRDEPHAEQTRWRRLHVIAGDANRLDVAAVVKVGAAQLVLQAIAAGARVPGPVDPVSAVQAFSHDTSCTIAVPCTDGRDRTAVQLQRGWLEAARNHTLADPIGDAQTVLSLWSRLLDDLEADPMSCADRIDWVAKLRLVDALRSRHGLGWDDPRLVALDLQWGDLDPTRSPASKLAERGSTVRLVTDDEVTQALTEPPADTRAWLRGTLLHRFGDHIASASWDRVVFDMPRGQRAWRLLNPTEGTREQWEPRLRSISSIEQLAALGDSVGWTTKEEM